ncbi:MAG: sigma-70 family RNA polymerase sigma factor [Planctomycetaceae bacterium]|nr:sigma-70 family RNA polymerase sigma factor [Planctomycetaceae bacterium]
MAEPIGRKNVDRLVVEHLPRALRFARRLTGDDNTAEDVVQEALCRILKRWRSYRGEASFGTWMMQIVVNVDRDRRRQQRILVPIPPEGVAASQSQPVEEAAAGELGARIRLAVDKLPDRQREVALLIWGEGASTREAAEILQSSEANVYTCLHLARKRIARAIGIDYPQLNRS